MEQDGSNPIRINCVILNFNDGETVARLVHMIHDYDYLEKIVLVDNHSTDDSWEQLQVLKDEKVELIRTEKNGGYGYGNNTGIRYAIEHNGATHVLVANPDVVFSESCVIHMARVYGKAPCRIPRARWLQGKTLGKGRGRNGWKLHGFVGELLSMEPVCRRIFNCFLNYPRSYFKDKKAVYVDAVHGSMLMISAQAFEETGGYDEGIFLYEEEQVELLGDLYALDREAVPETGTVCFDTLAVRNQVKTKIQEKVQLTGRQRILQVCHSDGDVKIDEVQIKEDGIHMDGVLEIRLLYLTADDQAPVGAASEVLPFHLMAAADGLTQDVVYEIEPGISGLTAVMAGGDAVEVKAQITADVLVLKPVCEQTVLSVAEEPLDTERLKKIPGIIGYVAKPGDSLWKIARMFHTSVERIMELNHLSDSTIRPGDRLILVKTVQG